MELKKQRLTGTDAHSPTYVVSYYTQEEIYAYMSYREVFYFTLSRKKKTSLHQQSCQSETVITQPMRNLHTLNSQSVDSFDYSHF